MPAADQAPAPASPEGAPFPHGDTFRLHSRSGSKRVIFLDFDGDTIADAAWNQYFGLPVIDAVGYDRDFSPELSPAEHDDIQSIWQKVSEDFAVFDVDVTAEDPGEAAITRSGENDELFGTSALVTNASLGCGCGGIAYVGVFNEPLTHAFHQPALVFSRTTSSVKRLAEVVSHEVGHNLEARVASGTPVGSPPGTVTFLYGSTVLCAVTLSGAQAECTPSLSTGTHAITAVYDGSPSFLPSTSATLSQIVSLPVTPSYPRRPATSPCTPRASPRPTRRT